jgi:uncharacterized sulfatase
LFAFLNLMGTHLPYRPPQDSLDRIAPRLNKRAYQFMRRFNAEATRWGSPTDPPLADWERQTLQDFYDAETLYQDAQLKQLFDYLDRSGMRDDTIVIITADHGEAHGDHNFVGHSFVVHQELVHVPLIVQDPDHRFPQGQRIGTTVSTRRVFHTLLDLLDLPPGLDADDPNADIKGLSLLRATNGRPDSEAGIVFAEAYPPSTFVSVLEHHNPAALEKLRLRQVRRGVYDGIHKLTVVQDEVEALYDTQADPGELADIAASQPDLTQRLQAKMADFVKISEAYTVPHNGHGDIDESVKDSLRALGYME